MTRSPLRTAARSAAAAVLALSCWGSAQFAAAAPPPTDPDTTPAESDSADAMPTETEFVASWTLTPGGSADGDEAGSRPNLSYQVAPGTTFEDTVIVYNLGNVPLDFAIYATDAFNNDDGEFDLLPAEDPPVDVGSWVALADDQLTLPPGKQATIPITVTVPVDATPGDHVGAIVAANTVLSDNGDGPVFNVERRTGTRMYVQVEGPLLRELGVTDVETDYRGALNPVGGTAAVTFRVENRGNVVLGGTPTVSIAGPAGVGKRSLTLPPMTDLLPGEDVTLTAELEGVPAAFINTTEVVIEPVESTEVGGVEPAVGRDRTFAPPISVLLILLAALLALVAWRAFRRHRKDDDPDIGASPLVDDGTDPGVIPVGELEAQRG